MCLIRELKNLVDLKLSDNTEVGIWKGKINKKQSKNFQANDNCKEVSDIYLHLRKKKVKHYIIFNIIN